MEPQLVVKLILAHLSLIQQSIFQSDSREILLLLVLLKMVHLMLITDILQEVSVEPLYLQLLLFLKMKMDEILVLLQDTMELLNLQFYQIQVRKVQVLVIFFQINNLT